MQRDYYQVLGVDQNASAPAIRAAFVRLSKRYHPDMPGSESGLQSRLHDVQQAYHCLSDADARAAHDRVLDENRRRHFAEQRAVRHRLQRYDSRHPHFQPSPLPRGYHSIRWRRLLVVLGLVGLIALAVAVFG